MKSSVFSTLFASHPPSQARVDANRASAEQLPAGGLLNQLRYQQEIAQLIDRQPAYKKADEAGKAIANKSYRQALSYAQQAIAMEPNESRFFELKGIALKRLNRAQDALQAYNKSIKLDPNYFSPLLRRGLLRNELKSFSEAERDLQASLKLAPTQAAYATLGEIAERKGSSCSQAMDYYQQAYRAGGGQNQEIQRKLAALKVSCPAN